MFVVALCRIIADGLADPSYATSPSQITSIWHVCFAGPMYGRWEGKLKLSAKGHSPGSIML